MRKEGLENAGGGEEVRRADNVRGELSDHLGEIKAPLATRGGLKKEEYVQGVTKDMLIILNLDALMSDERMIIHEEVA